jgi:hypothetical protein
VAENKLTIEVVDNPTPRPAPPPPASANVTGLTKSEREMRDLLLAHGATETMIHPNRPTPKPQTEEPDWGAQDKHLQDAMMAQAPTKPPTQQQSNMQVSMVNKNDPDYYRKVWSSGLAEQQKRQQAEVEQMLFNKRVEDEKRRDAILQQRREQRAIEEQENSKSWIGHLKTAGISIGSFATGIHVATSLLNTWSASIAK